MKKKIAALLLSVTALASMLLVGVAYALPPPFMMPPMGRGIPVFPQQSSWVRVDGNISKWGTVDVRGQLSAQAQTALLNNSNTRQLARVTATWTKNLTRPINAARTKQNFTYTFYTADLRNASVSSLTMGPNFFLNGTWNVATVNSTTTVITNANNEIVSIHRESDAKVVQLFGNLTVTDNWTKFTLRLAGQNDLTGNVLRSVTRQTMFNWYQVTDSSGTAVTRADVNAVVQCYRAMPGWGNYDNRMDFNLNYRIDIADIATVAAKL